VLRVLCFVFGLEALSRVLLRSWTLVLRVLCLFCFSIAFRLFFDFFSIAFRFHLVSFGFIWFHLVSFGSCEHELIWNSFGNSFGTRLEHIWNSFGTHLGLIWNSFCVIWFHLVSFCSSQLACFLCSPPPRLATLGGHSLKVIHLVYLELSVLNLVCTVIKSLVDSIVWLLPSRF
jgi:hypothetical protein